MKTLINWSIRFNPLETNNCWDYSHAIICPTTSMKKYFASELLSNLIYGTTCIVIFSTDLNLQ